MKKCIFSIMANGLCFILSIVVCVSYAMAAANQDYITTPALTINPDIIHPPVEIIPFKPQLCPMTLPVPEVSVIGTENYTANGHNWVRYLITVMNRYEYPATLFVPAPDLPPCGLNTESSRTWIEILDQDGNYIYGFCALGDPENLGELWFAVEEGEAPPSAIQIIMKDRLCEAQYASDLIPITPGMFSPPPLSDLELKSRWADTPPVIDGIATGTEWTNAGSLNLYDLSGLLKGIMYVKNDNQYLYILLDMTTDLTAGPAASDDYAGIAFDIGMDGYQSPYVDLRYCTARGSEIPGMQWALGEGGWTGVSPTDLSDYKEGFGPTLTSSQNHKFYEYKIDFSEININFDDLLANPENFFQARISITAVSKQPSFSVLYPSSYSSFENSMIRIAMDLGSTATWTDMPIISGIGLVPRTFINQTSGLATTGSGHQINVTDAPFGQHLRVIGNINKLIELGVDTYVIGYCNMSLHACDDIFSGNFSLSEWTFVEDARTNYYWNGADNKFVLESVSPNIIYDNGGLVLKGYPIYSPSLEWYFPNLLFDWRTTGNSKINSGLYRIHLFGFNTASGLRYIPTPAAESVLTLKIDNTYPVMSINQISYNGNAAARCAILQLNDDTDALDINISAYDPDGHLLWFELDALFGDNERLECQPRHTYSDFLNGGGSPPEWIGAYPNTTYTCKGTSDGKTNHWETCGYTFRIRGWDRAINGYGHIHYNSGHKTITILTPDYQLCQ